MASPKQSASPAVTPATANRARPVLPPFRRELVQVASLYSVSVAMLCCIFPPNGFWPLAFVALVPWAVATVRTQRAWLVHWGSLAAGWAFFLIAARWLEPVTGLGYVALAFYLAIYWTLAAWAIRTARRHRIEPLWSLPITWVTCEYLRAVVMTGFPWFFVGHALYAELPFIQIADTTGVYGVSFLALLVNGALVEAALLRWPISDQARRKRQFIIGAAIVIVLVAANLGYGYWRLGQRDFERDVTLRGPRVAVLQEDFPLYSKPPYSPQPPYVMLARYLALAAEAAREQPDLIVFPETAWNAYQNVAYVETADPIPEAYPAAHAFSVRSHKAVAAFARGDYPAVNAIISDLESFLRVQAGLHPHRHLPRDLPRLPSEGGPPVTVLLGAVSIEQFPEATYPKIRTYNSALVYDPDGTQRAIRYDKIHLVPFGEIVPFRQTKFLGINLHWVYRWLNSLSPFSDGGKLEYSLTPGSAYTVFDLPDAQRVWRFAVPICYEDTVAPVVRRFAWDDAGRRRCDFLVNISNDAWFLYSNELAQHLAICAFRAVENRVGIARAVNTGISAFIDPDGRIYSCVSKDGKTLGEGIIGYDLQTVYLDDRTTFYGRFGDLFAWLCLVPTLGLWLGAVIERWVLALRQRIVLLLKKGAAR